MKTAVFLLVVLCLNCLGQSVENRQDRVRTYYEQLAVLNSSVRQLQAVGVNPFQPDYSQPGGGSAYQTFIKLEAILRTEANLLSLQYNGVSSSTSYLTIEDGWYEATIKYSNSNTYTRSTYTLNVQVQSDRVVRIDFGNGGSVHSGYNNSGYYYSGGYLNFSYDFNGNIVGATTRVTVQRGTAYLTYDVEI